MATTRTLASLRTSVRQKADMENSQVVSDTELNTYINQSLYELYDLLVGKYEDYFIAPPVQFTTDGVNQVFNLPDGTLYAGAPKLYKLTGVDLSLSPGQSQSFVSVPRFNAAERNQYSAPNLQTFYGVTNLRYHVQGNQIRFIPLPAANQIIQLWYVPVLTTLVADTDTFDGISGWDEYVVIDAAVKCLLKEESDVSVHLAQKNELRLRIEAMAANRDAGQPATVADVSSARRGIWWVDGIGF